MYKDLIASTNGIVIELNKDEIDKNELLKKLQILNFQISRYKNDETIKKLIPNFDELNDTIYECLTGKFELKKYNEVIINRYLRIKDVLEKIPKNKRRSILIGTMVGLGALLHFGITPNKTIEEYNQMFKE